MRTIDGKFSTDGSRIFNTVSGIEIPADEPLFLLRARDVLAIEVLETYRIAAVDEGCNELHLAGIDQVIAKFQQFALDHPGRMKEPGSTRHLKLAAEDADGK